MLLGFAVLVVYALNPASALTKRSAAVTQTRDRTITKVVKLLEGMLAKSKEDGDNDREVFAKFVCYCNTKKTAKTTETKALTEEIALLESKIQELTGSTGALSTSNAQLKADMEKNEQARSEADALRAKEEEAFDAEKKDLEAAIAQMEKAIETLGEVGADQTLSVGADHKQQMAGFEGIQTQVRQAYLAASGMLSDKQLKIMESFLQASAGNQAPFTGTYTSQSGEVVGILKNMMDTFKMNLANAVSTEKMAKEAYTEFTANKKAAYDEMSTLSTKQDGDMGTNDGELAGKKEQLKEAKKQKGLNEDFLDELIPMCQTKSKEYQKRKALRSNEDAAITQAISILNSDSAFSTFGTVSATKTGETGPTFLQVKQSPEKYDEVRDELRKVSQRAPLSRSLGFLKISSLIVSKEPIDKLKDAIESMHVKVYAEQASDEKKLAWCKDERKTNTETLDKKKKQITSLKSTIDTLKTEIEEPEAGLLDQVDITEKSLKDNAASQKESTEGRTKENLMYQKNVANLVQAEELVRSALKVLEAYYAKLEGQLENKAPDKIQGEAAPTTWEGEKGFEGQSGQGNSAVKMLQFIYDETKKEEKEAHSDEMSAQHGFEDSMTTLKKQETSLQKSLVELKKTLAEKSQELAEKKEELTVTEEDKAAVENYLEKIKDGCDFITENFDLRSKRRKEENLALEKAADMLMSSPAYIKKMEARGFKKYEKKGCGKECKDSTSHAKCQACMREVTVRAFCVNHKDVEGCS